MQIEGYRINLLSGFSEDSLIWRKTCRVSMVLYHISGIFVNKNPQKVKDFQCFQKKFRVFLQTLAKVVQPSDEIVRAILQNIKPIEAAAVMGSFYQAAPLEGEVKAFLKLPRTKFGTILEKLDAMVCQTPPNTVNNRWLLVLLNAKDSTEILTPDGFAAAFMG
ncbi:MAG: hypothetical protein OXE94_06975 [Aestuariivita sp.]|nr:hypothetical protein [Aestuariivita sp.]MCY4202407.1 hypothetical protein [Aestuariivita sp.]